VSVLTGSTATVGSGNNLLIFIHGLCATSRVWLPMIETIDAHWQGRWAAIDLRGHGRAPKRSAYAIADYANDLAEFVDAQGAGHVTLLGHSLGGAVALAAAAIAPPVERVFALGVKVDWAAEELERMHALSLRPPRCFALQEEALAQHAREAGLEADTASALLDAGVVLGEAGWQSAMDRAALAIDPADMPRLLAAARCPIHLACGDRDLMVHVDRLRDFDRDAASIAASGHNAMVDAPARVWAWLESCQS
jgi:pimeloyl-ACP methyl ester carboxylesterase